MNTIITETVVYSHKSGLYIYKPKKDDKKTKVTENVAFLGGKANKSSVSIILDYFK